MDSSLKERGEEGPPSIPLQKRWKKAWCVQPSDWMLAEWSLGRLEVKEVTGCSPSFLAWSVQVLGSVCSGRGPHVNEGVADKAHDYRAGTVGLSEEG